MKKTLLVSFIIICLFSARTSAQQTNEAKFQPAAAIKDHYNALYVLNSADDKKIKGVLRNIKNVLNDPRLKGKLHIELIVFGDGVELYKKTNDYLSLITPLRGGDVDFVQCANTIEERKISKNELFDFIDYVPSANGEIILRQYEGWAVVHP